MGLLGYLVGMTGFELFILNTW